MNTSTHSTAVSARPGPLPVDGRSLAAVFAGGVLGGLARAALEDWWPARAGHWPWTTFIINIIGAFVLGALMAHLRAPSYRRAFLGTGVCGALTTFATLQVELLDLLDDRHWGLASGYALASIAAGVGAVALATMMVRRLGPPR